MKLVVGGYSQGKLNYIVKKNKVDFTVFDGRIPNEIELQEAIVLERQVIINHFHDWVKMRMSQGANPEEEILIFLRNKLDIIIISDEIGNGIVPMDSFEREYRERTGRILVELASRADEVVRVICGIGQKIK